MKNKLQPGEEMIDGPPRGEEVEKEDGLRRDLPLSAGGRRAKRNWPRGSSKQQVCLTSILRIDLMIRHKLPKVF